MSGASNTKECFRDVIGLTVVGVLFDALLHALNAVPRDRAEGDQQQRCRWCCNWLPSCWWETESHHECVHVCEVGLMRRGEYFRAKADAEGRRTREPSDG